MRKPAEVFPPHEFIQDELQARGWSVADLAVAMGCHIKDATEIVDGRERITPIVAQWLSAAFRVSPEFWLNLQAMMDAHGIVE